MLLLATILLLLLLAPTVLRAQAGEQTEAELRQWYRELTPEKRRELRHRMQVFRRMDRERQGEAQASARSGGPLFNAAQRSNLDSLRTMGALQRLRLRVLAMEVQQLRRGNGERMRRVMDPENKERAREIHQMLLRRRAMAPEFRRTLTEEERRRVDGLPERERAGELLRLYREQTRLRRERLIDAFPAVGQTRERAREGDADAREELRRQLADLWTLDLMLQRLSPEAQADMLQQISKLTIEDAGTLLRRAWQRQHRADRPPGPDRSRRDQRPPNRP